MTSFKDVETVYGTISGNICYHALGHILKRR
jgi:hypothetical protein